MQEYNDTLGNDIEYEYTLLYFLWNSNNYWFYYYDGV